MTQSELANSVGISQSSISMYETGERTPSLPALIRIAAALNCKVDDLIEKETAYPRAKADESTAGAGTPAGNQERKVRAEPDKRD